MADKNLTMTNLQGDMRLEDVREKERSNMKKGPGWWAEVKHDRVHPKR